MDRNPLGYLLLILITAIYIGLPSWLIYMDIVECRTGSPGIIPYLFFTILVLMLCAEPGLVVNIVAGYGMVKPAARLAVLLTKTARSPLRRLSASALAGQYYLHLGDYPRAEEFADIAAQAWDQRNKDTRWARRRRTMHKTYTEYFAAARDVKGLVCLDDGRYREALEAYYEPLTLELTSKPWQTVLLLNCAAVMNALGMFDQTLDYVDRAKAEDIKPALSLTIANCHAVFALQELGSIAEGQSLIESTAPIAVDDASRAQLAVTGCWFFASGGSVDKAKSYAETAREAIKAIKPPNHGTKYLRARLLTAEGKIAEFEGRLAEAADRYKEAINAAQNSAGALDALATLYERTDRPEEAQIFIDRLMFESPESFQAQRRAAHSGVGPVWPPAPAS